MFDIVWTIGYYFNNRELQAPDFSQGWLTYDYTIAPLKELLDQTIMEY